MEHDPHLQRVLDRMRSGVLSRDGFLGTDPRPLEEVLDADRSAVAALGTTHEEVAARLGEVLDKARAGLGTPIRIGDRLVATHREAMGRIPCPFGGCGTFPKGEVELTDPATGESLFLTALGIHMVGKHGFYQGRGSRYRLEPTALGRLMQLGGG
ncbi:MAG TPA: hypothetical protein VNE39_15835 [Planctomycetota bacterium]|nr:hypothetical protein [Planctomycetota bacterium]